MPIEGHPGYLKAVLDLVFRNEHRRRTCRGSPKRLAAPVLYGVGADTVAKHFPGTRIWLSNPTWANHGSIFQAAGLETPVYPYLTADKTSLDFAAMMGDFKAQGRRGDLVCLHACCHNPTGIDPTLEQWREISELLAEKQMIPFVDFAYQGFGDGLEADRLPLHALLEKNSEAIVCNSFQQELRSVLRTSRYGNAGQARKQRQPKRR